MSSSIPLSHQERLVAESVPGALLRYTLHADGRLALQMLNSRCQQLWELAADLVEQNPHLLWQMVAAEDLMVLVASLDESARGLTHWQADWAITTPSGARKWLQGSGVPERGSDGSTTWHMVVLDISNLKIAELSLERSDQRFHALVEELEQVSVQGYDAERRVIVWNKASELLYGFTRAEAMGRHLEDLIIPPEMREGMLAATAEWIATGVISRPAESLVLRHKDGRPVHVFSSHTMQVNSRGEAEFYCVDIDLHERHKLEAQLREAHKLEAIGRLAGGIAHDFNNVLGGLLGNVVLARDLLPPGHPALRHLDLIARGGEHARGLVQQILAFSRRQPQALEALALVPMVEACVSLLSTATPPGVVLKIRPSAAGLLVRADSTQLQQVVMNLCTNAWQALQGRPGEIEIGMAPLHLEASPHELPEGPGAGDWAHLWVRDEGAGMDEQTLTHLFEPFFTTKPVGEGTGLGLAVAHGIVLAHHGAIVVDSMPGQGSCFHVYLPLLKPEADAREDGLDNEALSGVTVPVSIWSQSLAAPLQPGGRHVLYLDDDEVMRLTAQGLLERVGCRVSLFQRGRAALIALAANPQGFDLVVTDFNMPDLSGIEVAQAVARIRPDLPVLLASGYWTEELQAQAREAGVRGMLRKERSVEQLGALVLSLLGPTQP